MRIMCGTTLAEKTKQNLHERIKKLSHTPKIAILLVGDDVASKSYIRGKTRACEKISIRSEDNYLPAESSETDVLSWIAEKNNDNTVHAILVQLPLPPHINVNRVLNAIDPKKDVDGFHPLNMGCLATGNPRVIPCTPLAILRILEEYVGPIHGSEVVILNRSNIVGKPLALLLGSKGLDATVTVCHSRTRDLIEHCRRADILVSAMGKAAWIGAEMVKKDVVIVDVSINRIQVDDENYRLVGDVNFEELSQIASAITPVPRGVGPMTIAMLLENTVSLAEGIA